MNVENKLSNMLENCRTYGIRGLYLYKWRQMDYVVDGSSDIIRRHLQWVHLPMNKVFDTLGGI